MDEGVCTKVGSDWSTALRVCFIARMSSAWVRARIRAKEGVRVKRGVGAKVGVRVRVRAGEEGCHREHAREP